MQNISAVTGSIYSLAVETCPFTEVTVPVALLLVSMVHEFLFNLFKNMFKKRLPIVNKEAQEQTLGVHHSTRMRCKMQISNSRNHSRASLEILTPPSSSCKRPICGIKQGPSRNKSNFLSNE